MSFLLPCAAGRSISVRLASNLKLPQVLILGLADAALALKAALSSICFQS